MKSKILVAGAILVGLFALHSLAFAASPDMRSGFYGQTQTPEQREAFLKQIQEQRDALRPLEEEFWAKSTLLEALKENPNTRTEELKALIDELAALRTRIADTRSSFAQQYQGQNGWSFPMFGGMMGRGNGMSGACGNYGGDRGSWGRMQGRDHMQGRGGSFGGHGHGFW